MDEPVDFPPESYQSARLLLSSAVGEDSEQTIRTNQLDPSQDRQSWLESEFPEAPRSRADSVSGFSDTIRGPESLLTPVPDSSPKSDSGDMVSLAVSGQSRSPAVAELPNHSLPAAPSQPRDGLAQIQLQRPQGEAFVVTNLLGKGGQGVVYEAWQDDLQRPIALKITNTNAGYLKDFLTESLTVASLDHPNVVPVHGIGTAWIQDRIQPVLVMKKVTGTTWRTLLHEDRKKELSQEEFLTRHLQILIQVLNALIYAHDHGIIHRDLKPAQVMVGDYGEVFLGDWGLALRLQQSQVPDELLPFNQESFANLGRSLANAMGTDVAQALEASLLPGQLSATNPAGTPAYMAPEQLDNTSKRLGIATDVYLVGALLYEILAGFPPHRGDNLNEVIKSALLNTYEPLPKITPTTLADIVEACLKNHPEDRPQSLRTISIQIKDYLTGADRKAQGRRLITQVGQELQTARNIEELSRLAAKLAEASAYYPDFTGLPHLKDSFFVRFARMSLDEGDLVLARIQTNRINDPDIRDHFTQQLNQATATLEKSLQRPPLLTVLRTALIISVLAILSVASVGLYSVFKTSLIREAQGRAETVADVAARGIRQSDLESVVREQRINSPEFQRTLNALIPLRRAEPDMRRITSYFLAPGGGWQVAVDSAPLDFDRNMDGIIDPMEQGRPPGMKGIRLPFEALTALRERRPQSILVTESDKTIIKGIAPVIETGADLPRTIVMVEIPTDRLDQSLRKIQPLFLAGTFCAALFSVAILLTIFHTRRSLEMVKRMKARIEQQEKTLSIKHLNLG